MKSHRNAVALSIFAALCAFAASAVDNISLNGRFDIDGNYDGTEKQIRYVGNTDNTVVRQSDYNVFIGSNSGEPLLGSPGFAAAWLLEGGTLTTSSSRFWRFNGDYVQFRVTGGRWLPSNYGICREVSANTADTLPSDFVYSGDGDVVYTNKFYYNGNFSYRGDFNLTVMDNARVFMQLNNTLTNYTNIGKIVAVNGGELITAPDRSGPFDIFYAFNGGLLRNAGIQYDYNFMFGNKPLEATNVNVRIYEKGARLAYVNSYYYTSNMDGYMPALCEPVGNVVWSIDLPDEVKNNNGDGWDFIPAVVIKDSTGAGSNAWAVVEYDYDTRTITGITIACRGENYSLSSVDDASPTVTAELRSKRTGVALATLKCETGPCQGGDVILGGLKEKVFHNDRYVRCIYVMAFANVTNTYHGATIIDADPDGERIDVGRERGGWVEPNWNSPFVNSPRLVIKSGALYVQGKWNVAYPTIDEVFPACTDLEIYDGYLGAYGAYKKYFEQDTITIGGLARLRNRGATSDSPTTTQDLDARVAVRDTLYVDVACMTNSVSVTPAIERGRIKFITGSKVAVKNWDLIPRGQWRTILDLSTTVVNKNVNNSSDAADACVPEFDLEGTDGDLFLMWEMNPDDLTKPYRLRARRPSNGMMLIFR